MIKDLQLKKNTENSRKRGHKSEASFDMPSLLFGRWRVWYFFFQERVPGLGRYPLTTYQALTIKILKITHLNQLELNRFKIGHQTQWIAQPRQLEPNFELGRQILINLQLAMQCRLVEVPTQLQIAIMNDQGGICKQKYWMSQVSRYTLLSQLFCI